MSLAWDAAPSHAASRCPALQRPRAICNMTVGLASKDILLHKLTHMHCYDALLWDMNVSVESPVAAASLARAVSQGLRDRRLDQSSGFLAASPSCSVQPYHSRRRRCFLVCTATICWFQGFTYSDDPTAWWRLDSGPPPGGRGILRGIDCNTLGSATSVPGPQHTGPGPAERAGTARSVLESR